MPRTLPKPIDTSALTEDQRRTRERLVCMGDLAYGPAWQTPLAEDLTKHVGRAISAQQVNHWFKAVRPVPTGMLAPLAELALSLAPKMEQRADALRRVWTEEAEHGA